jgi:hypothetical protein
LEAKDQAEGVDSSLEEERNNNNFLQKDNEQLGVN